MLHDQHSVEGPCPCDSGQPFVQCCEPAIEGVAPAPTAEALMRSRYTAFVLERTDYLIRTTHPDYRAEQDAEEIRQQTATTTWLGLHIDGVSAGAAGDVRGEVEFRADFFAEGRLATLREHSRFQREEGHWYYCDGTVEVIQPPGGPGRNDPCPCGSGRKFKRCCST